MRVDLSGAELHNMVKTRRGLETRRGLYSVQTPTAGTEYVGSFTVESPFTTEPWHYLFERSTSTGIGTMRVYTEEFLEMYSYGLGVLPERPVITHSVHANQIMINSPAFSVPLYGLVGGGTITAVKTASRNPDTTALEIPPGHICTFGDRRPIAQGNVVYFNDPGTDPRTYVAENALALAGTIYDLFQGPDGALYLFTSAQTYFMPADALGKGQKVTGFLGTIAGITTSRPRNAAASNGVIAVLQRDGIVMLRGNEPTIDPNTYHGPRFLTPSVEVEDYRTAGEVHPTPEGFLVGFRGQRGFLLDLNLRDGYQSYVWHQSADLNLVGTLRSREGDTLIVLSDRVVMRQGVQDFSDSFVRGAVCVEVDLPEAGSALVRRITTSSDNVGRRARVYTKGQALNDLVPTFSDDVVIGTTAWSASTKLRNRQPRTVRHSLAERATHLPLEICVDGGGRRIEEGIDVEFKGQGRTRRDKR